LETALAYYQKGIMGLLDFLLGVSIPNWRVHGMALGPHQTSLITYYDRTVAKRGRFTQGIGADGGHYIRAGDHSFGDNGIKCLNCVFYINGDEEDALAQGSNLPQGECSIMETEGDVANYIHPEGWCKLWVVPEELLQ
jgi:hypothetical protein